jgi:adenine-specific DNA methylase
LKEKVIDNVKADAMISAFKAAKMSTDEIKDVLKKHGYTKVIDVKVKDYASVMADIKA